VEIFHSDCWVSCDVLHVFMYLHLAHPSGCLLLALVATLHLPAACLAVMWQMQPDKHMLPGYYV